MTSLAHTNNYQVSLNTASSATLSYDQNGNMTSDGTNSYSWDAENRLIKVTYPGTNNYSTFAFDGLGQNVQILEYSGGSLTNTKQYVWSGDTQCEARTSSGSVIAQYFPRGETISGTSYFWCMDHIGSVREMTTSAGSSVSDRAYDPYGQVLINSESVTPDFGFAGYYLHVASGLGLTMSRPYDSKFGRFICPDPISEAGGTNLFEYAMNNPATFSDRSGQAPDQWQQLSAFFGTSFQSEQGLQRLGYDEAVTAYSDAMTAVKSANSSGLHDPEKDAYRHCVWSCLMTNHIGATKAKIAGDIHEVANKIAGTQNNKDKAMDYCNNAIGRNIAKSKGTCQDKCKCKATHHGLCGPGGSPV